MCRHVASLGAPEFLHQPLFGAPHSLCTQALTPRFQDPGDTNPDGWGVAWYVDGVAEPRRHRTVTPIWHDTEFADASRVIETGAFLGAARMATPGSAIDPTGNAPFVSGPWAFSLNGFIRRFRGEVEATLRARVSLERAAGITGDSDSELLFALVLDRLDAGDPPAGALAAVIAAVLEVSRASLNLVLTDGTQLAATRLGHSLFARGATIASEPLDGDPRWREVPDGSVVFAVAEPGDVMHTITAL